MLTSLEQRLGHTFKAPKLLERALTHRSQKTSRNQESFERLEFLGDRVLGLVIAETLYLDFEHEAEGILAKRLASLVSKESCGKIAQILNISTVIKAAQNDVTPTSHILSDAVEALIGAIFLDADFETAKRVILHLWAPLFLEQSAPPVDYKTALQEWSQKHFGIVPTYTLLSSSGPDHAPEFLVEVKVGPHIATASGNTKRSAETKAAAQIYQQHERKKA